MEQIVSCDVLKQQILARAIVNCIINNNIPFTIVTKEMHQLINNFNQNEQFFLLNFLANICSVAEKYVDRCTMFTTDGNLVESVDLKTDVFFDKVLYKMLVTNYLSAIFNNETCENYKLMHSFCLDDIHNFNKVVDSYLNFGYFVQSEKNCSDVEYYTNYDDYDYDDDDYDDGYDSVS